MHHLTRGLATFVVTSLTTVGLAAVATPPVQAAAPPGALLWEISQQFDDHLSVHVLGDGATEDADGVISFPGGVGSHEADGTTSVAYQGSVSGSFEFMGTTYYTVTVEDPIVTIDEAGDGQITAVVSASNAAGMGGSADSTTPTRVVVTTFDGDTATWAPGESGLDTVTATPHWAGVLPANSEESAALGIGADKPVDGQSFNPAFLGAITSGVRAHFYASGSGSDAKKPPATFTAQVELAVPAPAVEVTTTGTSYADGLDLSVAGSHFTGVTNPGDDGVYVGLAEAGALPDTSQMNLDLFAAAAWVPASAITDGSFVTALNAPTDELDRSLDYSVYTWQAHTHSNTGQDTETPVTIDWSALQPQRSPATVAATWAKKPTRTAGGKVTVKVTGAGTAPTGKVVVRLVKQGAVKKTLTKTLRKGTAPVALPRLTAGPWQVRIRYLGSASYFVATKVLSFRVRP